MKNLIQSLFILLFVLLIFSNQLFSQAPEGIIYQAEARNNNGEIIADETLEVKIAILESSTDGTLVWEGNHKVVTNNYGMFILVIGTGTNVLGYEFGEINWENQSHFLNVKVKDPVSNFWVDMGTTQFLSVPYALHAKTASSLVPDQVFLKGGKKTGVPSQNWSLFGNSKSDPTKDFLGTSDFTDLVMITDNMERLRIFADGDINIKKSLEIGEDLTVKRNVFLNTGVGGATINYGPFTVEKQSPTYLTGILTVDDATLLKNTLTVVGATDLKSTLNVDLQAQFNSNVNIDATTTTDKLIVTEEDTPNEVPRGGSIVDVRGLLIADSISIAGGLDIGGNLRVHGDSVIVDHHLLVGETSHLNGQVTINANVTGGESSYGSYPLRVEGSDQGIAIKVNNATPNNSNNFLTFFDSNENIRGRIEGETALELLTNPEYIVENALYAANITMSAIDAAIATAELIQAGVAVAAAGTSITTCVGGGGGLGAVAVVVECAPIASLIAEAAAELILKGVNEFDALANVLVVTADAAAFNLFKHTQIGVTYQSGAGDYAEWLPKANPNDDFHPGDVVGVKAGIISNTTNGAENIMVVSSKPIVLGNTPEKGEESAYEKIAFMGQVPVKVYGIVNEGDYIIPSGNNDGFGIAINPSKLKSDDYQKIIGIAWSESNTNQLNYVNVAVGINANDVAKLVVKQEEKIEEQTTEINQLKARLDKMDAVLARLDCEYEETLLSNRLAATNIDVKNTEEITNNNPSVTYFKVSKGEIMEGLVLAENKLRNSGVEVDKHPFFIKIKNDPEYKENYLNRMIALLDNQLKDKTEIDEKTGVSVNIIE